MINFKNTIIFLLIAAVISFCSGCKKDKTNATSDELPAITQTGANTFGCLINGQVYRPTKPGITGCNLCVEYDPTFQGGKFNVSATRYTDTKTYVVVNADSIHIPGTYPLIQAGKYKIYYGDTNSNCGFETISQPPSSGSLTITKFDTVNRIVSGTFSFNVSSSACGTIDVTDGRFDVKF